MIGGLQELSHEYSSDEEIIIDPGLRIPRGETPPAPTAVGALTVASTAPTAGVPTFGTIPAWGSPSSSSQSPMKDARLGKMGDSHAIWETFDGEGCEGSPTKKWPDPLLRKHEPPPAENTAKFRPRRLDARSNLPPSPHPNPLHPTHMPTPTPTPKPQTLNPGCGGEQRRECVRAGR